MICLTCKTNEVPKEQRDRLRFICDECLHADVTGKSQQAPVEKPPPADVHAHALIPVLRNAKRRLTFGLSPDALHAIREATGSSSALFHAAVEALVVEAQLTGSFEPPDAVSPKDLVGMFLGYLEFNSSNVIAGVLHRCIERLETAVR